MNLELAHLREEVTGSWTKSGLLTIVILGFCTLAAQSAQKGVGSLSTYMDDALGFSYTYPLQLVPNTRDFHRKLKVSAKDQSQGAVLLSAFDTPSPGKAREGVVISAENASTYGVGFDAKQYLQKVNKIMLEKGWTVLDKNVPAEFDGHKFLRSNYKHTNPVVFQSVVCTIRNGSLLEFILSGGSEEEINQLVQSLDTIRFQNHEP